VVAEVPFGTTTLDNSNFHQAYPNPQDSKLTLSFFFLPRYIVAATTTWSGASYIYTKDAVTILKAGERLGRSGRK